MARARGAGASTGVAVALAILALWAVGATIAWVLYYTQIEALEKQTAEQAAAINELASTADTEDPEIAELRKNYKPDKIDTTVVTQLRNEIKTLRSMIIENPKLRASNIQDAATEIVVDAESGRKLDPTTRGLLPEIQALVNEVKAVEQEKAKKEEQIAALKGTIVERDKQLANVRAEYEQNLKQLQNQLTSLQQQVASIKSTAEAQQKTLATRIDAITREKADKVAELNETIAQNEKKIQQLKIQLGERTIKLPAPTTVNPAEEIDGNVIAVIETENSVWVNLGRNDNLMLGLTFEVFDQRTGVPKEAEDRGRGKATIEIIRIEENRAQGRIVRRSSGESVQKGDAIYNAVYDKDRRYVFYVHGEFDIDGDGTPSQADRRRIESMIQQWDSRVLDNLTYEADFVVLGKEPEIPRQPSADAPEDEVLEYKRKLERYQRFQEIVGEARELRIPILNQNRFLTLVGYYQR